MSNGLALVVAIVWTVRKSNTFISLIYDLLHKHTQINYVTPYET